MKGKTLVKLHQGAQAWWALEASTMSRTSESDVKESRPLCIPIQKCLAYSDPHKAPTEDITSQFGCLMHIGWTEIFLQRPKLRLFRLSLIQRLPETTGDNQVFRQTGRGRIIKLIV